jgi:hypothetical protein
MKGDLILTTDTTRDLVMGRVITDHHNRYLVLEKTTVRRGLLSRLWSWWPRRRNTVPAIREDRISEQLK